MDDPLQKQAAIGPGSESVATDSGEKIRLGGASKTFHVRGQTIRALAPIDLAVRREEFVALVGPSGCGKSTILNLIAGLLSPTSGTVLYDGQPVRDLNRRVGYMTQKDTLLPWRRAADNIRVALELKCRPTSRSEADERVARMMDLVGLKGFENHYPSELSGGMRKRTLLGRTLIRAVRRPRCAAQARHAGSAPGAHAAATHDGPVRDP
jgi:NitT/TauT family transport system ATP-binding protein